MTNDNATRLAAAAPAETDDDRLDIDGGDDDLHELFEAWSTWSRTRRFFAPPQSGGNILGKMRGSSRPMRSPPDAKCNTFMPALHLAIQGQPRDALDYQVFMAYYGHRVTHIKATSAVLGISRQHFYRLLRAFGQRVVIAARHIEAENVGAGDALPHRAEE
jgi:hypothetical protein